MNSLKSHMKTLAKDIVSAKLLLLMREQRINQAQFKFYIIQRISITNNFENLLVAGINQAKSFGDDEIECVLQKNLADERGELISGHVKQELAHKIWRQNFLSALCITDKIIQTTSLLPETLNHSRTLLNIENAGDLFCIVGALLALELIIPIEYRNVKISRDYLFPDLFVPCDQDSIEIQESKFKAGLYINDHIQHDLHSHYPDLLRVLSKYETKHEKLIKMMRAVNLIKKSREIFFRGVENHWNL